MIELVFDKEPRLESPEGLVAAALGPAGHSERDVDPRLRIVVGRCRSLPEHLAQVGQQRRLTGDVTEDRAISVDRHDDRPHDRLGTDRKVDRCRQHAPLLEHVLGVGSLPDRDRLGQGGGQRLADGAAPGGDTGLAAGSQSLARKLHGEEPVAVDRRQPHGVFIGGHCLPQAAEFVLAFPDERGSGDRIDPPLSAKLDRALVFAAGDLQRLLKVPAGQRGQGDVEGLGGNRPLAEIESRLGQRRPGDTTRGHDQSAGQGACPVREAAVRHREETHHGRVVHRARPTRLRKPSGRLGNVGRKLAKAGDGPCRSKWLVKVCGLCRPI